MCNFKGKSSNQNVYYSEVFITGIVGCHKQINTTRIKKEGCKCWLVNFLFSSNFEFSLPRNTFLYPYSPSLSIVFFSKPQGYTGMRVDACHFKSCSRPRLENSWSTGKTVGHRLHGF